MHSVLRDHSVPHRQRTHRVEERADGIYMQTPPRAPAPSDEASGVALSYEKFESDRWAYNAKAASNVDHGGRSGADGKRGGWSPSGAGDGRHPSAMGARGKGSAARLTSGQVFAGRAKRVRAGEGGDSSSRVEGEGWWTYTLTERRAVALDTFFFRFAPPPSGAAVVAPGQHVWLRAYPGLQRQYTPVAVGAGAGAALDFIIKVYRQALDTGGEGAGDGAGRYGRMTQHLAQLPIGSTLEMSAPGGRLRYVGKGGALAIAPRGGGSGHSAVRAKLWQHWGMVAGGTGITPMLVLLRALFAEPAEECDVTVTLVAAFRTESAVLARAELEALAAAQVSLFYLPLHCARILLTI